MNLQVGLYNVEKIFQKIGGYITEFEFFIITSQNFNTKGLNKLANK